MSFIPNLILNPRLFAVYCILLLVIFTALSYKMSNIFIRVTEIEDSIHHVSSSVDDHEHRIDELKSTNEDYDTQIESLRSDVDDLQNRRY